jgi:hypothetical protein
MKHFVNNELSAANVIKVPFDPVLLEGLRATIQKAPSESDYTVVSPPWSSDIKWISPNSIQSYKIFLAIFEGSGISQHVKPFVDFDKLIRMYTGFLVVRSQCTEANYHVDWKGTDNDAFTLITPLSDNARGFGLIYKTLDGRVAEYDYRVGEAVIFGDKFLHSTKPGQSEKPVILLSFTFGTDKMKHWPKIWESIGTQSNLVRLPNGTFLVRDIVD